MGTEDEIAKAKRARRFEREHEIERQRARTGGVGFRVDPEPSYTPYNHNTGHITQGVGIMSLEPGYDPVSLLLVACVLTDQYVRTLSTGIVTLLLANQTTYLKTISV